MTGPYVLPDQMYIEQLINRLWTGREVGQAAVMVGAGFSRNANRITVSTPVFPLWEELASIMFDALYPNGIEDRDEKRSKVLSGAGALRLASEYQEVFGRMELDDLLLQAIPDSSYSPGLLHEMLLSLPWSDIFTTNYDTLLERTLPLIYERKYDVIVNASDLPGSTRPRIVKLHGSFPSNRPFIITEDDFRTYPRLFAPFVNTVQQSLMENVLCLIGFSGDDPNFLYWTGWVRDNLGVNSPLIYLCGLLDLTHSQRQVLKKRNVIPIDLSPLFPKANWPDAGLRHSKALEWLLITLLNGAPPSVMDWPESLSGTRWKPSPGLPETPSPNQLSNTDLQNIIR
ncbi:MAG TPA: SIR2 family protein [Blastocatellia bacterium]|nr:SIR2 family protein [Blastocatellia bacterium]